MTELNVTPDWNVATQVAQYSLYTAIHSFGPLNLYYVKLSFTLNYYNNILPKNAYTVKLNLTSLPLIDKYEFETVE